MLKCIIINMNITKGVSKIFKTPFCVILVIRHTFINCKNLRA